MSKIRRFSDNLLFSCLIGLGYFLHSLRFHGPAYLSDEIGYLARAIVISGNTFETRPGGWHAGYSFLVAPIFAVTDSPQAAWVGVVALNSVMWATAKPPPGLIRFVRRFYVLDPHSLVFVLSALGLLLTQIFLKDKVVSYLALMSGLVVLVVSYQAVVHPWYLGGLSSAKVDAIGHYDTNKVAPLLSTHSGIEKWLLAFSGQLGYIVLATFGIGGFAFFDCLSRLRLTRTSTNPMKDPG